MSDAPEFIYVTCQMGAEPALKRELSSLHPELRFSFSRPGYLTFKLPPDWPANDGFTLHSTFARAYGYSLGKAEGATSGDRAAAVARMAGMRPYDALHVWQRDLAPAGHHGYQPIVTDEARTAEVAIRAAWAAAGRLPPARIASRDKLVFDCIVVEPDQWWLGRHRATSIDRGWPGGIYPEVLPESAVSRAYLKMSEALAWSALPIAAGQQCAEIGCAPGGASQALLDRGLLVMGIDPAEVAPGVLEHPNFVHVRKRGADVRRREFRKVRWLMADMNVAPQYTLDTVEEIVTHREANVRGVILQLKLLEWELADHLPEYAQRVRGWGYRDVRLRQLSHNRQEVCLAASRGGK
jgi:23S rRNA (cytidine2498-2'-O)-methyltransferase